MASRIYRQIQKIIEEKALLLKKHEDKNHAITNIPFSNYVCIEIRGRTFVLIFSTIHKIIIEINLLKAIQKYPDKFGTGNALDVLTAIYDIEPFYKLDDFIEILKSEKFCYVVELKQDVVDQDNILRIDLFRHVKPLSSNPKMFEFIGGLFHCFKHFSYNDVPLSTDKNKKNVFQPINVLYDIIQTFYFGKRLNPRRLEVEFFPDVKHVWHLGCYFEENTGIYFVNTFYERTV